MSTGRYIPVAETAKLVRKNLAREFPGVKFYVRSKSFSGGASIDIEWLDGPSEKAVEAVVAPFRGRSFDGSIDMACHNDSWLMADGSVRFAGTQGTEGSMGYIRRVETEQPEGAERVHFGSSFIGVRRALSPAEARKAIAPVCKEYGYVEGKDYTVVERVWWLNGKPTTVVSGDVTPTDWCGWTARHLSDAINEYNAGA